MVANELLMQFQADMLNVPVARPRTLETTALGAAYAAGLAVGYWQGFDDLRANWAVTRTWTPAMPEERRAALAAAWHKAVERSFGWAGFITSPALARAEHGMALGTIESDARRGRWHRGHPHHLRSCCNTIRKEAL